MKVKRREKRESHKRKRLRFVSNVGQPFFFISASYYSIKNNFLKISMEKKKKKKWEKSQISK